MKKIKTNLVEFDDITMEETVNWIASSSAGCKFQYIVTPNIDHLERLINSEVNISDIYTNADLCLCDSRILAKLLHFKDKRVKEVITGSTLTKNLFDSQHMVGKTILVVGGEISVFTMLLA